MKSGVRIGAFTAGLGCLLVATLSGAEPAIPSTRAPNFPRISPPPLPPVVQFDHLLRASLTERTNQLAGKSEAARGVILRELAQFDTLTGGEREQRILQIKVAQLRFYLRPLLKKSADERVTLLRGVPAEDRTLIESRLSAWDALPNSTQREVLESDEAIQHFVRQASARRPAEGVTNALALSVPAEVVQNWERWQALPVEERTRREGNFRRLFDLTTDEQVRAIGALPAVERQRMERALRKFSELPAGKRELCVQNFERLARLSDVERSDYLRNAAKWDAMSQNEREAWRRLVMSVPPPPMPPVSATVADHK